MQNLFESKRFLSACIASLFVVGIHYLFKDNLELAETITTYVVALFGGHILGTTASDMIGKGKIQEENKKIELELQKAEIEKQLKEAASHISMPTPTGDKGPGSW